MKSRHILMAAGLIASAGLVLFGDAPTAEVAKPLARSEQGRPSAASVRSAAPVAAARVASRSAAEASQILQLLPRQDLIAGERAGGDTERLFAAKTWQPPPAPPKVEAPPPPPSAPPLPYTYVGKQLANGVLEIYLARGDRVFTVRNQSVIEGLYRVESIEAQTLSLLYLPLNQKQTLSIGVQN